MALSDDESVILVKHVVMHEPVNGFISLDITLEGPKVKNPCRVTRNLNGKELNIDVKPNLVSRYSKTSPPTEYTVKRVVKIPIGANTFLMSDDLVKLGA